MLLPLGAPSCVVPVGDWRFIYVSLYGHLQGFCMEAFFILVWRSCVWWSGSFSRGQKYFVPGSVLEKRFCPFHACFFFFVLTSLVSSRESRDARLKGSSGWWLGWRTVGGEWVEFEVGHAQKLNVDGSAPESPAVF